jgi:hypothetical protein
MPIATPKAVLLIAMNAIEQKAICGVSASTPVAIHPLYIAAFRAAERSVRLADFRRQTAYSMN